jgi:hypothetical protein
MDWHEAYLRQARSEYAILGLLNAQKVQYCHRLHYLQMVTEKLAKGIVTPAGSRVPAPMTHAMFVRMMQVIKGRPNIRRQLGYSRAQFFSKYIDSLLDMATRIESLAPDRAGVNQPNPEYPWWKDKTAGEVCAPADYGFPEFHPGDPRMIKIQTFVSDLLRLAS